MYYRCKHGVVSLLVDQGEFSIRYSLGSNKTMAGEIPKQTEPR